MAFEDKGLLDLHCVFPSMRDEIQRNKIHQSEQLSSPKYIILLSEERNPNTCTHLSGMKIVYLLVTLKFGKEKQIPNTVE